MKKLAIVLLTVILSVGAINAFAGNSFVSYKLVQQNSLYHHNI